MSVITITITDQPGGGVTIIGNPRFEEIIQKNISGNGTTAAEGYALSMMKLALKISKDNAPQKGIHVFGNA